MARLFTLSLLGLLVSLAVADARPFRERRGPSAPVLPDPGTLTGYRGEVGRSFLFEVTGSCAGSVWGTSVYTDDSSLAAAAVHAGVLADGQTGVVRVTILPGYACYDSSTRYGVTSGSWGNWVGSFRVEPADARPFRERGPTARVLPDPGTLTGYRAEVGRSFLFEVTGSCAGSVWGTGVYTDDSSLAKATVHAGVLADGQTGVVRVTILPGYACYDSSTRHGVNSGSWGSWVGSFRVEPAR
jgi:hypothetical protein